MATWTIPRTWTAGEIVTAANVNTHLRDNLLAISGAWVTYTCTWSGTLGNGTKSSFYTRIGRTIHYRITVSWGSTTSHAAASQTFTLPVAENANISFVGAPMGIAGMYDASAGQFYASGIAVLSTGQTVFVHMPSSTTLLWTAANPTTWASGDILSITGTYEASTD